jgi:hypothetical protein
MVKCDRVGCHKEATHHEQIALGKGFVADTHFCDEHYKEGTESVRGKETTIWNA